jgi:hypothetical protein
MQGNLFYLDNLREKFEFEIIQTFKNNYLLQ